MHYFKDYVCAQAKKPTQHVEAAAPETKRTRTRKIFDSFLAICLLIECQKYYIVKII